MKPGAARLAVLAWRLGLGPILGRSRVLLTTFSGPRASVRYSLVPYRFAAGNLYVEGGQAPWRDDLATRPQAMAQASTGPLAVRARRPTPQEADVLSSSDWLVLEPTADTVPNIVPPDLTWVWPSLLIATVALWRLRRRRRRPRE